MSQKRLARAGAKVDPETLYSHPVSSPCEIWLPVLIPCACWQWRRQELKFGGCSPSPPFPSPSSFPFPFPIPCPVPSLPFSLSSSLLHSLSLPSLPSSSHPFPSPPFPHPFPFPSLPRSGPLKSS